MKKSLLPLIFILLHTYSNAQNSNYNQYWKKVEDFELKDLPKSALAEVEKIYTIAQKEKNSGQIIKAMIYRSKFYMDLQEDAQLKIINDFKSEIQNAGLPERNILESILADLYWQYFRQNRYKFYDRTKTEQKSDPDDFRTWDLQTLSEEVHEHFTCSLQNPEQLQEIPVRDFSEILNLKKGSEIFRPTIYDFLAHRALVFYKTDETNIQKPEYRFSIENKNLLKDNSTFIATALPEKDSFSNELKAIYIFKDLTRFHLKDKDPSALIDLTLERLNFIKDNAAFDEKDDLYLTTLKELKSQYKSFPIATEITYNIAKFYDQESNQYQPLINTKDQFKRQEALKICEEAVSKFPKSEGSEKCKVLIRQIKQQSLNISIEKYVSINTPSRILISYKNLNQLTFKIYKVENWQKNKFNSLRTDSLRIGFINKLDPVKQWTSLLKNEKDYQHHSTEVLLPALNSGTYLIIAQKSKNLVRDDLYAQQFYQITDLSLVRIEEDQPWIWQVIDRNTGEPVKNAKVHVKSRRRYARKEHQIDLNLSSDKKGFIQFEQKHDDNLFFEIRHKGDQAYFGNYYLYNYDYRNNRETEKTHARTFLFTDRSIYRPGQTIYYKGILILKKNNKTNIISGKSVKVTLFNVNREKVKETELITNDYGSFNGEFILPSGGLTGEYFIEVAEVTSGSRNQENIDEFETGMTYISVEEYKRPKFETSFKPVTESFQLNDSIKVTGEAISFSGAKISGAKVKYRVARTENIPSVYRYYPPYPRVSSEQEITHGETITDQNGKYIINFKAIPDLKTSKDLKPVFNYIIYADVTDINGETHSTKTTVRIAWHLLETRINISESIDKNSDDNKIVINTQNLNGEFVPVTGILKIYKLQTPERILRKSPWDAPDYPGFTKEEFKKLFPHDAYQNENDPKNWKKGNIVFEKEINTETTKEIVLDQLKNWKSGKYVVTFTCTDRLNQKIENEKRFELYSNSISDISKEKLLEVTTDKSLYKPGEKVTIKFATAAKDLYVTVSIEKDHKTIERKIIHLSNESKTVNIPVNQEDAGGFGILYHTAFYNSFTSENLNIVVPFPDTELKITTRTFRDKIQPGSEQQWSFNISGPQKDKVTAEVLASMYDASLDQFKAHQWSFNPVTRNFYHIYDKASAGNSFGKINFNVRSLNYRYSSIKNRQYDRLNWFGFSFNNNQGVKYRYLYSLKKNISDSDLLPPPSPQVEALAVMEEDAAESIVMMKNNSAILSAPKSLNDIMIRGKNSLSNSKALIIIDGVPVKNINDIDLGKEDIISMQVLKGEEAIALYGEKAKDGAIVIVTKSGQEKLNRELNKIKARSNFNETAFFYPDLTTDKEGNFTFNFTAPEALTQWKLQLLAHTKDLKTGYKQLTTITQKELMIVPNVPRFLRETDAIVISSKITNLSDHNLNGTAQIQLTDALTGKDITAKMLEQTKDQNKSFSVDSKNSTNVNWKISVPKNIQAVQYRIVAKAGDFSDGEQNILPVLSNRMLVTESMTMQIRGNEKKTFSLEKLKNNRSKTLSNHKLTLEITSNPVWYALQAMPYLMEYPYECSEQIFSRYYANTLAAYLMNSNPKIEQVFKQWSSSDALISNLEKNPELKSIIIQETPWLRDAQSETEQKKRFALLFDLNKMKNEQDEALSKLKQMQRSDGGFPWFSGGRYANRNITQQIAIGFGKLNMILGKDHKLSPKDHDDLIKKSIAFLDQEILKDYKRLLERAEEINKKDGKNKKTAYLKQNHTGDFQIQYLYMRSFFKEIPLNKKYQEAVNYYRKQSYAYWTDYKLYTRGLIAITAKRKGDVKTASDIYNSLKERSITSEEMGMYWKDNRPSWYWYQSPVQTQTTMMEVFDEMGADDRTMDNLKLWLLKNKQTNSWETTKATTNAIYAILTTGTDWLSSHEMVKVRVGKHKIDPLQMEDSRIEAGTGYFKTSWNASEIKPDMAEITLEKESKGVAFGGLYWQYFEDLDQITSAKTGIKISKELFIKKNTAEGIKLFKLTKSTKLKVGDLVTVRIEIRSDREMEFIHLKDMRASGFEPVNTLSEYKYQDNLFYYESTKDASTNFFIDRLPKGVFIFEYDLRVNNQGNFSNGITTLQSMYAPEFTSHSKGVRVNIEE